jgi:intein/homing endonuclease
MIVIQTEIGWIAAKVVEENEELYIVELGDGSKREVLKEEVFTDDDGNKHVLWW